MMISESKRHPNGLKQVRCRILAFFDNYLLSLSDVNGIGRIKAIFLVHSHHENGAVTAKAAVSSSGTLTLKDLKCTPNHTDKKVAI